MRGSAQDGGRGCVGEAARPPAPGQETSPKPAEPALSCAVSARQKAAAPGTVTSNPRHASLVSLKTPCQQVRGAEVKQLLRSLFACAKTASAHTSYPHAPPPAVSSLPARNLHVYIHMLSLHTDCAHMHTDTHTECVSQGAWTQKPLSLTHTHTHPSVPLYM